MAKEDKITLDAEVTEALPDAMFKVRLQNDQEIIAYVSGKMRKFFIRILPGDKVQGRIAEEFHRVDVRQSQGYIDPYRGDGLRDRLRRIRQETNDMASQHNGGLSGDEQRALNDELGAVARDINR